MDTGRQNSASALCTILMEGEQVCGRPVHPSGVGVDAEPVCIMHSRDLNKDPAVFGAECRRILQIATRQADFSHFVFPTFELSNAVKPECRFVGARFFGTAKFTHVAFEQGVHFNGAQFDEIPEFWHVKFKGEADFGACLFKRNAVFQHCEFLGTPNNFSFTRFEQAVDFRWARFAQAVTFWGARFAGMADFLETRFEAISDFREVEFAGRAEFRETVFAGDPTLGQTDTLEVGPIFSRARFIGHEAVLFYKTHLGRALFHNCDISRVRFSKVRWRRRKGGGHAVFEEVAPLTGTTPVADLVDNGTMGRDYRLIAELYHQLRINYDERGDYWNAGAFHYGEMEMSRLDSHYKRQPWRLLHQNLRIAAFYKYLSSYGQSYWKPFGWLVLLLITFAAGFCFVGLRRTRQAKTAMQSTVPVVVSWCDPCPDRSDAATCLTRERLWLRSVLVSVEVASLQRELTDEPSHPWGDVLRLLEVPLTSTLAALLLLALRRRFKRG